MRLSFTCRQAAQPFATMIKSSAIRGFRAKGAINCLLTQCLPPLSSAKLTTSTAALRERVDHQQAGGTKKAPLFVPWTYRNPALDVAAGGGPRPKTPRQWRTKTKRGSISKSEKLIDVVKRLSNSKEEVYGALDAWIAWDLEFPLIAVKKALKILKDEEDWRRIIQVTKWMLDKGQGRTLGTYQMLLQAFDHEGRVEEAQTLWEKVLKTNVDCVPRTMFAQVISMYYRSGKYKDVLKVFADMDELQVKADGTTIKRVARCYEHFGYGDYAESLLQQYPTFEAQYRYVKGKKVKIQPQSEGSAGQQTNATSAVSRAERLDDTESLPVGTVMTSVERSEECGAERNLEINGGVDGKTSFPTSTALGDTLPVERQAEQRLGTQEDSEGTAAMFVTREIGDDQLKKAPSAQSEQLRYELGEMEILDSGSNAKKLAPQT